MSSPTKNEIETIFNKLRSQATNKICFDCSAKNPTWASVTYGVFICIDCSAVHRSLGVHLTFVRSTNLDTNWTWLQIRQMQVGGNANASQFFRQHNCNTADAQQKYNSRAAQLYRDKISTAAQNAMKQNGTKLHLDVHHEKHEVVDTHETDFFAECSNENFETEPKNNNFLNEFASPLAKQETEIKLAPTVSLGEPNVDLLNSVMPSEPPKSTIGVRKIQPKKSGIGAKKGGLGATKVKTNFADIEQRANMSDQLKPIESVPTPEQQIETVESVRLAYQDLSIKKSQEEEKMKSIDPVKAKQLERLGMGFNVRGAVSHSAVTDMKTISQESTGKFSNKSSFDRDSTTHSHNDSYDEYSTPMYSSSSSSSLKQDEDLIRMGFEAIEPIDTNQTSITTMFSSGQSSKSNSISQQPGQRRPANKSTREIKNYENDEAQKKFGNTKAISSDQFFGNDQSITDRSANLARFQGSNSISSSDFFNEGTNASSGTSRKSLSNVHFNAPDLDDVKESVRQGVTKVAGRLSSLANDVMSSIQDKYGY